MSRRHPLCRLELSDFTSALWEQIAKALVTCRHQVAGNFLRRNLLLLLGDLAGLLRSLLHCALRLLCLLSFLGHVALLISEIALVAACTRESKCTTSRIHQHIQKNSVQLKEVLTQCGESARSGAIGDTSTRSSSDAKSLAATDMDVCQY